MRLFASVMLSICMILTSGPLMAAYSCNNKAAAESVSGYKIAEKNMNSAVYNHVKAVSKIPQPVQGVIRFTGSALISVTHGGEGLTRTSLNAIRALFVEANQAGQCTLKKAKRMKVFGMVDCVIVAGSNAILISAATINGALSTVEYAVVKVSDEFFNAAQAMSDAAADWLSDNNAKILALPFIVFSKVMELGRRVVRGAVAFVTGVATSFVSMVGNVLCNIGAAFSALFNGKIKKFLKLLLVGTVGILLQWMADFINDIVNAIKNVFRSIGKALQGNNRKAVKETN